MFEVFDCFRANSVDSPLVHIEDCPSLPIAPVVVKAIANNWEEREYLGFRDGVLSSVRRRMTARASRGFVFSGSRVRMRYNEITSALGSVFGSIVSFWH
jgi:hypothetical protein